MSLDWEQDADWVVLRSRLSRHALVVRFSQPSPSMAELAALRRISGEVALTPLGELKRRVGNAGTFVMSELGADEASEIAEAAKREGLLLSREVRHHTVMVPLNRRTRMVCLMEDDEEARRVCLAMIAAGRPLEEQEVE